MTDNPDVSKIIYYFGGQSVISSIDVKKEKSDYIPYKCNGSEKIDMQMLKYMNFVIQLGVGEIFLNSIDRDGTGFGFDLDVNN